MFFVILYASSFSLYCEGWSDDEYDAQSFNWHWQRAVIGPSSMQEIRDGYSYC